MSTSTTPRRSLGASDRGRLLVDVATAGSIVAPYWPLTAFVAVNPLGGLTDLAFADAAAQARSWYGARTHLSLEAYRAEYARGTITDADLDEAILRRLPTVVAARTFEVDGRRVDGVDIVRWDLLHGPTVEFVPPRQTSAVATELDGIVATWCAAFVDETHTPWQMPDRERGFYCAWRAAAGTDRRLAAVIDGNIRARLTELPDDPAELLDLALIERGIDDDRRVAAIRTWILRTPGWAGLAKWFDDWAPADRAGVRLRMLDLAAVRAAMDHLAPDHLDLLGPDDTGSSGGSQPPITQRRCDAAVVAFGGDGHRSAVTELLGAVDEAERAAIWLSAHEGNFRDRLLARLGAPGAAPTGPPSAQLVFCIDVRSEGLRRRLEELGAYDTFGFAGFFGVPVRWRPLGSDVAQARCPVLVSPRHEVAEVAVDGAKRYLSAGSVAAGLHDAFHAAKGGIASPFALAESAGWFAGPVAASRTLAPRRTPLNMTASGSAKRPWWKQVGAAPRTTPVVDELVGDDPRVGLSLEERTLFAEAIVTTIGMAEFAPVVVLCGHGSVTSNNPHASSLDCGACGGAPGGASARIAALILNDPAVRSALVERGIRIPDHTWFVAAEHDTASDTVRVFDHDAIPAATRPLVEALQRDLDIAGERNSIDRSHRLPGSASRVRDRGRDWAEVRPEWGLAGNAAFIIGPRSATAGHDLSGRAFLHSYVAERDPDGVALETIMTAPLVVAQWISSQYYFSTVEPEVFGAGDKMLHNPVGGIGVMVGQCGDLAVGLPMQSVMLGGQRAHDPLRLLAVVQAPLERIDGIIARNGGLRQLVEGEWIHVAARASDHDSWSLRLPGGGWGPWHLADESMTEHRTSLSHTNLSNTLTI